ncbi:MAG: threonine--tRNA ligase [Pseudomonadota bacterium]
MTATAQQNDMINITLPDGVVREYDSGVTGLDIAKDISTSLAKAVIAIKIDGEVSDLSLPINGDASIALIKREDEEALELIRHDAAHVMAEAVQKLFPDTQVTIGPSIENGFYYDFARDKPFSDTDFAKIEKEMRKIVERNAAFEREVWDRNEAIKYFKDKGEDYKAELIEDLPEDEEIKIYRQGEWLDLCRGPHMPSTKHVGTAFKLMKVAGAYWRGDSNNAMLTRIYGTAWRNQKELDAYLTMLEEAEARDHRKLGREMDLFHLQEEAQGSVFWHPKGHIIYNQMEAYVRRRLQDDGYDEVRTPQLMHSKFWKASGHWQKYREDMFVVPDVVPNNNEDGPVYDKDPKEFMALKPMNCPAHVQIFNQGIKSYRDLPIRLSEFGCCHRNEAHGALHGLMRLRQFVQDDAHIFCTEDQILEESIKFFKLVQAMYKDLGFEDYQITFETRPEMRVGSDEIWDKAEEALEHALKQMNLPYEVCEGDGAFYGPKVGFIIRDAIGREWGCGTLQLDFNLPERLDANYIAPDGSKQRPVMLHRAALGALERFIGIMIENYAGKLPLWLTPVQCVVASITGEANDYAQKVYDALNTAGIRAELDIRNEKINYKVREHSLAKVPALFVVGAREAEGNQVAIRRLGSQDQNVVDLDKAIEDLVAEAKAPN